MIAQTQPAYYPGLPTAHDVTLAQVIYTCRGGRPSKFNNEMVGDIVVEIIGGDGAQTKIWGNPNILKRCAKGTTIALAKGPAAKNWKVVPTAEGSIARTVEEARAALTEREDQRDRHNYRAKMEGLPMPQPKSPAIAPKPSSTPQGLDAEIHALTGLWADCYSAAQHNLRAAGAPAEAVQACASSAYIQLTRAHGIDAIVQVAAGKAKTEMGW